MKRLDSDFLSRGTKCAGWLYLPDNGENPPVVIMAHGFGGLRTFRLPAFAEKFCAKGLAVFLFEYRNFGDSEGEPRNLISPKRHLEDWQNAIAHIRSLREVNPKKIALWGTSFSGGHILVTAARNPEISCAIAQVPFVDGRESARPELKYLATAIFHGLWDLAALLCFRNPHYVPIISTPDRFALMNTPECWPGFLTLVPPGAILQNQAPARIILNIPFYRPIKSTPQIKCPVLIVYAEKDSLIPSSAVEKTAGKIQNVKTVKLPVGHFEVYTGELFERVSELESLFLIQHLAAKP